MAAPKVHLVQLENGFRALLLERKNLPVVASTLWYNVGSRDERTGETGLSHFLEHMMFKGTDRYAKGEIDLVTSKLGGHNNALTDNDSTVYYFSLAADRWEAALEIEANRMQRCLLDPDEFEAEKSVVLEEYAQGADDPWRSLWEATESLAYQVHPYHHPIIGWHEDLQRVTVDQMRAYYERNYGPNRAVLVAVGDFDAKQVGKRIESLFGGLKPVAPRDPVLVEPVLRGERRGVIRAPGNLTRLAMAVHTCRLGERDDFSLDILSQVLGSGKSSRLHRRLVLQDELVTHVSMSNETRLEPGLLWVLAELRPDAEPGRVEEAIREELAAVCEHGIDAAELKRARVQIGSSFLFEDETVLKTAMKLGRFEALSDQGYKLADEVLPTYDSIHRRELRETATKYLRPDGFCVMWSLPEDVPVSAAKRRVRKKTPRRRKVATKRASSRNAAATKKSSTKKSPVRKKKAAKPAAKKRAVKKATRAPKPKPTPAAEAAGGKRSGGDSKANS